MKIALYKMHLSGSAIVLEYDDSFENNVDMERVSEIAHVAFIMRTDLEDAFKGRRLKAAQKMVDQAKAHLKALENDES